MGDRIGERVRNVEAGLTRRYTNSAAPGSVETYDQAQFKTYDVLVDGITVEQRRYRRTAGGMGSLGYQFVVDEAAAVAATEDGVVRVRYQDVDADYDPSIADVWATPVMAGLDGPDLADGATVTARSTMNAGGLGTANLTDGIQRSVASSSGYTPDPPRTTVDAEEWVRLDLGEPTMMDTVVLFPRTETATDKSNDGTDGAHFPRDFRIEVSQDGTAWATARTVVDQPYPGASPQTYRFADVEARYVRVFVTELGRATVEEGAFGFHRLQLSEVDVRRLTS